MYLLLYPALRSLSFPFLKKRGKENVGDAMCFQRLKVFFACSEKGNIGNTS
jgi:hypothetical protein